MSTPKIEIELMKEEIASRWGKIVSKDRSSYLVYDERNIDYFFGTIREGFHYFRVLVQPLGDSRYALVYVHHLADCPVEKEDP